jgi:hypothetical protein
VVKGKDEDFYARRTRLLTQQWAKTLHPSDIQLIGIFLLDKKKHL